MERILYVYVLINSLLVLTAFSKYVNFKFGSEYEYKFHLDSSLNDVGRFSVNAKVGYTNIDNTDEFQEILLRIYTFTVTANSEHHHGLPDFSKWFSFEITRRGEILKVYHPPDDSEVLAIKKGFAAIFSSKLHSKEEIKGKYLDEKSWKYSTEEVGNEGPHSAIYTARETPVGIEFTKQRKGHVIPNAKGTLTKVLHFHKELGIIHKVMIEENFTSPKAPDSFDPHENMRKVKAENDFDRMSLPEMSAFGKGELVFVTRHEVKQLYVKPKNVSAGNIHVDQFERNKKGNVNVTEILKDIRSNITCIRNQPLQGSPLVNECFFRIVSMLKLLSDEEIKKIAWDYFQHLQNNNEENFEIKAIMLDAFEVLNTNNSQQLIVKLVLLAPKPEYKLFQRFFIHVAGMEMPPHQSVIKVLEDIAFHNGTFTNVSFDKHIYNSAILTLGSVVHKLSKKGQTKKSFEISSQINGMLGLHDPWEYRHKRSLQTEEEQIEYDHRRVILLEALGNARMDHSYDYIISHINSTNSPWIKRSGIHALRKYEHEYAANAMLNAALFDVDQNVRYEALLQYRAHPKSKVIEPLEIRGGKNNSETVDPYSSDIKVVGLHLRKKRGFFEDFMKGFSFRIEPPGVDYRKMLGSKDVGASFGVIIKNNMYLKVAPLGSAFEVDIHDEAYARVHLGIIDENLDFFRSKLCFKGDTSYNLDLFQENDMKNIGKRASGFDAIITDIVDPLRSAIRLFKKIIQGSLSIKNIFQNFVRVFEELPLKIANLRSNARKLVDQIGSIDESQLPPFVKPVKNLVDKVQNVLTTVKSDIMGFYNKLMQAITVTIPDNGRQIFESIKEIIHGFGNIVRDPKTALAEIGKGAVQIFMSVISLLEAKNTIQEACNFVKGDPPEWFDLSKYFEEVKGLHTSVKSVLNNEATEWMQETFIESEDSVYQLTKGKFTTQSMRRDVVSRLRSTVDEVLDPFSMLNEIAQPFIAAYESVFGIVKAVKDAYHALKNGYHLALSAVNKIFGAKAHKKFPRKIRLASDDCYGLGTYPSSGGGEYWAKGIDVEIKAGEVVVAPFPGSIMLSNKSSNEIIIKAKGGSIKDMDIIITNVEPNKDIVTEDDPSYVEKRVAAGEPIGNAITSKCTNHIHFAMKKDEGFVDPTKFLENRFFQYQPWEEDCDDYLLVWKFETLYAGVIVGKIGQNKSDTSPKLENGNVDDEDILDESDSPDSGKTKRAAVEGFFSKLKWNGDKTQNADKKDPLNMLLKKAKAFMKKYSIKRLKIGSIVNLLDKLNMYESKEKMNKVLGTIKRLIDNRQCFNPKQATDEQLRTELTERGKSADGTREQMITRLLQLENQCPFMSITMPDNVVCIFDQMCLGVECCMHITLAIFRSSISVFARLDPKEMKFVYGINGYKWTIKLASGSSFDGVEGEKPTGIQLPVFGGVEVIVRYKLEKTSSELYVTLGAGFCYQGDYSSCLIFINVLENAMLAIPKIRPGYRVKWPNTNKKKFLDEHLLGEKQKSVGKKVTKKEREEIIEKMCSLLSLPEKLLTTKGPCQRPDLMTKTQLNYELQSRGLSLDGSLEQRQSTLETDDKKCKHLTLPDIRNKRLKDLLYYSVSPTCLRLDACFSPSIKIGRKTIKKSFKAFVDVDNCNFIVTLGFEGWRKSLILISYDWGKKEELHITDEIKVMFSISRNEDKNQFSVNLGMMLSIQGSVLIDEMFIQDMHVPIPFCDSSFKLPGDGSLKGLVESLGNKMTSEGFKLVLKQFGLDKIFPSSPCTVPDFTTDCPLVMDPKKYLPSNLHGMVRCNMTNDCFGLHCCLDLKFTVPFGVDIIELSVPMLFKMDSCNFEIEARFGNFKHKSSILNYDWGNEQSLKIGSGEPAPIIIRYSLNKDYNNDIIVNVQITICFNIGEETFCIPENGFHILNNQIIPSCSRNFTDITKFSVSNWMKETSVGLHDRMKEAAVHYVLEKLDLEHLFEGPKCDRKRKPYIPSVQGWHNECKFGVFRLPDVENMMSCHLTEFCTGIKCCGVIPVFGLTLEPFLIIDPCEYVIFYGINKINRSLSLFDYEWGKKIQLSLANNVIKIEFSIRKPPGQKIYIIDLSIMACLIDGENCVPDIKILDSTQFRQIVCDLDVTFNLKNFSLNNWIQQIGSNDVSGKLSTSQVRLLLQQLGLDKHISFPGCKRADSKYLPTVKGWKSDCTHLSSAGLVELPKYLSCSLSASCTAVDCCMDFNLLNLTLNFHMSVDTCGFIIKGAIEKLDFELPFSNYVWGDFREVRLREVIRIM